MGRYHLLVLVLAAMAVSGCKGRTPPGRSSGGSPAQTWRYEQEISGAAARIYAVNPQNDVKVLIHVLDPGRKMTEKELTDLAASEAELTRRWRQSTLPADPSPDKRHDALIEMAENLEACHDQAPTHLGILRDLLLAYGHLLVFEESTSLGGNLILLASQRAIDFERLAAPLDDRDATMLKSLRAWLFFVMKVYPCAAEQLKAPAGDPQAADLQRMMDALGQGRFLVLGNARVGPLEVCAYRTLGQSPAERLLWGEFFFVVRPPGETSPHRTTCYTLTRSQDDQGRPQYAVYFRSLNRTSLVRIYGSREPSYEELCGLVDASIRQAVAGPRGGGAP